MDNRHIGQDNDATATLDFWAKNIQMDNREGLDAIDLAFPVHYPIS
jgi:hypothetical protein